ncbi:MAG: DUF2855 family protein [Pseudomonadota bacterium]
MTQQHWISKADLRETSWQPAPETELKAGYARLKVEAFALTANNVTYAAFGGPPMNYWGFYPSSDGAYGRVPVWGFATVIESGVEGVTVGEKVYGYLPVSETFDIEVGKIKEDGFSDVVEHRAALSPIYNRYTRTSADPSYSPDYENQQMLFRPLYMTGWMICDSLIEGVDLETVVISSASSKTAIATAHSVKARTNMKTIGLTSAGNKAFTQATGLYDEVLTYDQASDVSGDNAAYVDFVGRPALTETLHATLGDTLKRSLVIGVTDWEAERTMQPPSTGPTPEFFFVPDYAANRAKALKPGELDQMVGRDLMAFYPASKAFVTPKPIAGKDAIAEAWTATLDGKIPPNEGLICSF